MIKNKDFFSTGMLKSFGIEGLELYFCNPKNLGSKRLFVGEIFDLVAQLVEHPDLIGRALSQSESSYKKCLIS